MSSILIHIPSAPRAERQSTTPDQPTSFSILFTAACIRPGSFQSTWRGVYNQKSTLQVQPASRPSRRSQRRVINQSRLCVRAEKKTMTVVHACILMCCCRCVCIIVITPREARAYACVDNTQRGAREPPHTQAKSTTTLMCEYVNKKTLYNNVCV